MMTSWLLRWEDSLCALRLNNLIVIKLTVKTKFYMFALECIKYDSHVIVVRVPIFFILTLNTRKIFTRKLSSGDLTIEEDGQLW